MISLGVLSMKENLLTFQDYKLGVQSVTLNIKALDTTQKQREKFEKKFQEFMESDAVHPKIIQRTDDKVTYKTECIIPKERDLRPPLLLIFGNPASHSVYSEMFFSSERNGKEHHIWKILSNASILSFPTLTKDNSSKNVGNYNQLKKEQLYKLSYESPFRIGLAVYYSMPSTASKPKSWAGVIGLESLFGRKALREIAECEKDRITRIIERFISPDGAVFTFQKDAYSAIKDSASPEYSRAKAIAGQLIGRCQFDSNIKLFGCPPTRLLRGRKSVALLKDFVKRIRGVG